MSFALPVANQAKRVKRRNKKQRNDVQGMRVATMFQEFSPKGARIALADNEISANLCNIISGYSADGSAPPWGGGGRGFKSRYSDQKSRHFCLLFYIY